MVMLGGSERFWSGATMRTSPSGSRAALSAARPGEETLSSLVRTMSGAGEPKATSAQFLGFYWRPSKPAADLGHGLRDRRVADLDESEEVEPASEWSL